MSSGEWRAGELPCINSCANNAVVESRPTCSLGVGVGFYGERTREAGAEVHELHQRGALDATVARRAASIFAATRSLTFMGQEPI